MISFRDFGDFPSKSEITLISLVINAISNTKFRSEVQGYFILIRTACIVLRSEVACFPTFILWRVCSLRDAVIVACEN